MSYNIKDLNVSSLDFTDIVESLTKFLEVQPQLKDIDFRSSSSAANMLINILATATAYNGVYSYFGFNESFKISAQNVDSFSGLASNEGILLPFTQSASVQRTIESTQDLPSYTNFTALSLDGSLISFFNIDPITVGTNSYTLYSGSKSVAFTDYNYEGQYILIPLNIDPRTIKFNVTDVNSGTTQSYIRVNRGEESASVGNYFTVINGPNGYIVTNNFINSNPINLGTRVSVYGVQTNGKKGNGASITPVAGTTFITTTSPSGGYDMLSVEQARSLMLINGNGRKRWVTLNDLKYAILSSTIIGTDDISKIVVANGNIAGSVKVYVDNNLTSEQQTNLLEYLTNIGPAGTSISYSL
jgi:hypothetical protein